MKLPPRRGPRLKFDLLEDRSVPAADVSVTLLGDVVDGNTSSIAALLAAPGSDNGITLTEAILAAENSGGGTIDFSTDASNDLTKQTIFLTNTNIDSGLDSDEAGPSAFIIRHSITIEGSGQVIQRGVETSPFRLFTVLGPSAQAPNNAGSLTIENVELNGGYAQGGSGSGGGGGAAGLGGAVFNNNGTVNIRSSTLTGNSAVGGNGSIAGVGGGGGLGASATDAQGAGPNGAGFNQPSPDGGFGGGGRAGLESNGGNGGFGGGGGGNAFGGVGGNGGFGAGAGGSSSQTGIDGVGGFGGRDASGNSGGGGAGMGGAVFNLGGHLRIVDSTLTQNSAVGGLNGNSSGVGDALGGAVFNLNGDVSIVSSTLVANQADVGGSLYNLLDDDASVVPVQNNATALLSNSIFEDSSKASAVAGFGPGRAAPSDDEIHNLQIVNMQTSGGSFVASIDASAPNITNGGGLVNESGDAQTGGLITEQGSAVSASLADNGGPTRTLAIGQGSSAQDTGSDTPPQDPGSEGALTADQRGLPRLAGAKVDLGAFEIQTPPPVVSVVATTPTADENGSNNKMVLTFTRTGDLTNPLTITYSYSTDFTAGDIELPIVTSGGTQSALGSVVTLTFDANSDTVTMTVTAANDIQAEADETGTITLIPQQGIAFDQNTSATVTILQNDFVVTNTNDSGEGSLRQAILNADHLPNPDAVTFIESLEKKTITLTSFSNEPAGPTAFNIDNHVVIEGTGQTITRDQEGSEFRFFHVASEGGLTLENLVLQGGLAHGGAGAGGGGGAAGLGGAIFNEGDLVVRNSTFVNNSAIGGNAATDSGGGGGGGLGGDGASAPNGAGGGPNGGFGAEGSFGGNGGFGGGGGGASNGEPPHGGNGGFGGGGGGTAGGIGGNGGFGAGGGASFFSGQPGFGVNDAGQSKPEAGAGFGGAIFNYGHSAVIVNSTFTRNSAYGGVNKDADDIDVQQPGYGGALFNLNGSVDVRNSTFASNVADVGGSLYNLADSDSGQGIDRFGDADMELHNSIFVDSFKPAIPVEGPVTDSDDEVHNAQVSQPVATFSQEISGGGFVARLDVTSPNITNNGGFVNENGTILTGNPDATIHATRPVLSPTLADNGGLTPTLALAANSEAIDAGDNNAAIDPTQSEEDQTLEFDQRGEGFPRFFPAEGTVDLGAFERQTPAAKQGETYVITTANTVAIINTESNQTSAPDPFPDFGGETRVAVGDINHDGFVDFVFAAGDLGGPRIRAVSGKDGTALVDFFAYSPDFRGGVYVAVGDLDGDGYADIVTGAGERGGPHVRAWSGKDGSILANFFAFDEGHRGGVTVAVGDVNGDGTPEIITGSGPGDGSEIRIFDGTKLDQSNALIASLFPYGEGYKDGVYIAAGNLNGDKFADIVAGPLVRGSTTQTVVFDGATLNKAHTFFEDEPSLYVGLRFTIVDANGDGIDDMVVAPAEGGGPRIIVVNPLTGEQLENFLVGNEHDRPKGGYSVG